MRWLAALPFSAVFTLKTLVYGAIAGAVLGRQPGERLLGVVNVHSARTGLIAVCRAIVFHGGVMNTTGRLEQATREVGCFFIASAQALASLGPLPDILTRDLGALALRGRAEAIHAFCVEHSERGAAESP
jgi:class 3 adenylate cyclase